MENAREGGGGIKRGERDKQLKDATGGGDEDERRRRDRGGRHVHLLLTCGGDQIKSNRDERESDDEEEKEGRGGLKEEKKGVGLTPPCWISDGVDNFTLVHSMSSAFTCHAGLSLRSPLSDFPSFIVAVGMVDSSGSLT